MAESDDEIFWGPVTTRELQIISHQLSGRRRKSKTMNDSANSAHVPPLEENHSRFRFSQNGSNSSCNYNSITDRYGQNSQVQDNQSSGFVIPEITITQASPKENPERGELINEFDLSNSNEHAKNHCTSKNNMYGIKKILKHSETDIIDEVNKLSLETMPMEQKFDQTNSEISGDINEFSEDNISGLKATSLNANETIEDLNITSSDVVTVEKELVTSDESTFHLCADSTETHLSSHQDICETCECEGESCKSCIESLGIFDTSADGCSVNTLFSRSVGIFDTTADGCCINTPVSRNVESVSSNDCDSLQSNFASLNCIESHLQETNNISSCNEHIPDSLAEDCSVNTLVSRSGASVTSNDCVSLQSNFASQETLISPRNEHIFGTMADDCSVNTLVSRSGGSVASSDCISLQTNFASQETLISSRNEHIFGTMADGCSVNTLVSRSGESVASSDCVSLQTNFASQETLVPSRNEHIFGTMADGCSVNTLISRSGESVASNDCVSLQSNFGSLNCIESHVQETNNSFCNEVRSTIDHVDNHNSFSPIGCESYTEAQYPVVSNVNPRRDSQLLVHVAGLNICIHAAEDSSENRGSHYNQGDMYTGREQTLNNGNVNTAETSQVTPIRNLESKIPVPKKSASDSDSSKKKTPNDRRNTNPCGYNCPESYATTQHIRIPLSSGGYIMQSSNLVPVAPDVNYIPPNFYGTNIQFPTFPSTNGTPEYSKHASRNSGDVFHKKSCHSKDKEVAAFTVGRQSSSSESSEADNLDRENGSVLCSSLLDSSCDGNENGLNDTLEEMEMMMKHGFDYMRGDTDDNYLNQNSEQKLKNNHAFNDNAPRSAPQQRMKPRGLERCQYIRASQEEINPSVFQTEIKYVHEGSGTITPVISAYPSKPLPPISSRPVSHLKKATQFSDVMSPVGAYIKNQPVSLIKNSRKVKSRGRDNLPPRILKQEAYRHKKKTLVGSSPILPEVVYNQVPGINVKQPGAAERCGSSKKPVATLIKHAGRAVLAAVPQNAVEVTKHAEVSVLYDKEVIKTTTI